MSEERQEKTANVGKDVGKPAECISCRYCWCECGEDIVCGHPTSYAVTSFGLSVNADMTLANVAVSAWVKAEEAAAEGGKG